MNAKPLFPAALLGLAAMIPLTAPAQDVPRPPDPLIANPPQHSSWIIRPVSGDATATPGDDAVGRQTEAVCDSFGIAFRRPGPNNKPLWSVIVHGIGFFQPPHFATDDIIVTDYRSGPNKISGASWFFPELGWVGRENYRGTTQYKGKPAHHFTSAMPDGSSAGKNNGLDIDPVAKKAMERERASQPVAASGPLELWTDVSTCLPLAFKNAGGLTTEYRFGPPKPWPKLPEVFEKAIKAYVAKAKLSGPPTEEP